MRLRAAGLLAAIGLFTACVSAAPAADDEALSPGAADVTGTEPDGDESNGGAGDDRTGGGDAPRDPGAISGDAGADGASGDAGTRTTPPPPPAGPKCPWAQLLTPREGISSAGGRLVFDPTDISKPLYLYPRPTNPTSFVARIRVHAITAGSFNLHYVCRTGGVASFATVRISSSDGTLSVGPRASTAPAPPPGAAGVVLELGRQGTKLWARSSLDGVELGRSEKTLTGTDCKIELKAFPNVTRPGHIELDDFVLDAGKDSCWDDFAVARTY